MAPQPEEQARAEIDRLLGDAGWSVQDYEQANLHAARGVALREIQLNDGYGEADCLLYVEGSGADEASVSNGVCRIKTEVTESGGKVKAGYGRPCCATHTTAV